MTRQTSWLKRRSSEQAESERVTTSKKIERVTASKNIEKVTASKKMSAEKGTGKSVEATGKVAGAPGTKRPRGKEGGPSPKVVKLQDLQATICSLVPQALSIPGTLGIGATSGRAQPLLVLATPVASGHPKESGVPGGCSVSTP